MAEKVVEDLAFLVEEEVLEGFSLLFLEEGGHNLVKVSAEDRLKTSIVVFTLLRHLKELQQPIHKTIIILGLEVFNRLLLNLLGVLIIQSVRFHFFRSRLFLLFRLSRLLLLLLLSSFFLALFVIVVWDLSLQIIDQLLLVFIGLFLLLAFLILGKRVSNHIVHLGALGLELF